MSEQALIEISLGKLPTGEYPVEVGCRLPGIEKKEHGQAQFDLARLGRLQGANDLAGYGKLLTDELLENPNIKRFFNEALAAAHSAGRAVSLQVRVQREAAELHGLVWESLIDPDSGKRLAFDQNLLLSRRLYDDDWTPVERRPRGELKALIAVANPKELERPTGMSVVEAGGKERILARVDVQGEVKRAQETLREVETVILASSPEEPGRVTIDHLIKRLQDGCDFFYLACHGALLEDAGRSQDAPQATLILEDENGSLEEVAGEKLAQAVGRLQAEQRPRLAVLASCESAGGGRAGDPRRSSDGGALAALGPLLSQAGVAAVVAMQGNVTMDSAAAFGQRFFEELLKDGWVERAAAAARSAIEAHEDWWAPVIYLRLSEPLWPEDRTIDYANLPAPGEAPYKGLQYFDVSDAGLFFGRQALTARLIAHLKEKNFLAVVGASGSGKSSLVRAGLMPALRSGEPLADGTRPPQDSARWLVHIVTPTAHPLESLAASLTREAESVTATATLIDDLRRDARSLHLYALRRLAQSGSPRLLVVVDQFEEVFTACKDPGERQVFVDNLIFAGRTNADGPTVVVITLRADFYPHCAQYDGLRAALEECQIYIGAMNRNELRAAIEEPAKLGNWTLEAGLVDLILDDVGDEPGGLPLLSHALLETWKRRQRRSLTLAGYTAAGGVHKAIAHTADALYGSLNADEQRIAQGIFLRLTELGEGAQDTRRRARLDELAGRAEQSEQVERVLKRLADARLITTSQEEAEVAHEALIREWPTLRQWLEDNRAELRLHRRLTEAAQEWNSRGRDPAELYRGNRLAQVGNWSKEHAAGFSSLEKEFLAASQAAQASERRKRRVQWASIASVLTLLGLVIVASVAGWLDPLVYRPVDMQDYWVTIPAGVFLMGSEEGDPEAYEDEVPQHPVQLAAYQIGRYEITNRQYWQCVRAGICVSPKNDRYILGVYQDHPVTDVSWNDAVNFCRWIGGRLPSEAEWEKAARGTDGRRYPWGNHPPDCSLANITDDNGNACIGDTAPVDSNPDGVSPYGVYNLAGNVWEWTQSLYLDYPYEALDGRESFEALGDRVLRGGAWYGSRRSVRSADRYGVAPDYWNLILGFRCARSL